MASTYYKLDILERPETGSKRFKSGPKEWFSSWCAILFW